MARRKKAATPVAVTATILVSVKLYGARKVTTSAGKFRDGQTVELPRAEADSLIAAGFAILPGAESERSNSDQ